jgi:UrcA family protein
MAKLVLTLLAAPLALTSLSMPAAAQEPKTVVVRYDDLNLASVTGRERLNTRIKYAIQTVCETRPSFRPDLRQRAYSQQCAKTATRDADVKLASLLNGNGTALADRGGKIVVSAP